MTSNRKMMEERQLQQLRALLRDLAFQNRFYDARLKAAGLDGGIVCLDEFVSKMPFTTKKEVVDDQRAHPPYGTNLTFSIEAYTRFHQTSGSTGTPLRWLDTPESWNWMVDNWVQVFCAAGVLPRDRVYFAFSFGPFLGFWTAFDAAERVGCLCVPGGGLSSAARLQSILDNEVTVLCCTPTYALRLPEVARTEALDLSKSRVKVIIVAGEPGGSIPATRRQIEADWPGARVFDHHGMTEVGPVSFECPVRAGTLHIMEHAFFAEVLDPKDDHPVVSGQAGELILTTLGRNGSPLLRYRTGDLVRPLVPGTCGCGREDLALEGGILGRTDDMVIVRGVNVFPSIVESVIRDYTEVVEFQVKIDKRPTLPDMKVIIECLPACKDGGQVAAAIQEGLRKSLNLRIPVEVVPAGALPRFEMKAKRWIIQS